LTFRAKELLTAAEVVIGYSTYINLVEHLLQDKEVIEGSMYGEIQRCQLAIQRASQGQRVALVSSGDPGIYGMAGPVLELAPSPPFAVEIVPGVSAAQKAAALLGAPLMNDFAVISLSDLLTPWEVIEKRIAAAAMGDFTIALYNPKSQRRTHQIERARKIILQYRDGSTPVGIVRAAGRPEESIHLASLADFTTREIDMVSVVIIGCSQTRTLGRYLVTLRGYDSRG